MTAPEVSRNHFVRSILIVAFVGAASTTNGGSKDISRPARTGDVKTNGVPLYVPSTRTLLPTNVGLAALNAVALSRAGSSFASSFVYVPAGTGMLSTVASVASTG